MFASQNGHVEVVRALLSPELKPPADVKAANKNGDDSRYRRVRVCVKCQVASS